jgi:hypothetical protein
VTTHHLPLIVTKIIAFLSHVTIHIKWSQWMNLYLLTFSFIQYPLSFATNIACDLFKMTNKILVEDVICD